MGRKNNFIKYIIDISKVWMTEENLLYNKFIDIFMKILVNIISSLVLKEIFFLFTGKIIAK